MRYAFLIPLVLLTGCAPSACAPLNRAQAVLNAPSRTLVDEKTVLAAELGYSVALDKIRERALAGEIKGADAARIAVIIRQIEVVRPAVHDALAKANQPDLLAKFNSFRALAGELAALGAK